LGPRIRALFPKESNLKQGLFSAVVLSTLILAGTAHAGPRFGGGGFRSGGYHYTAPRPAPKPAVAPKPAPKAAPVAKTTTSKPGAPSRYGRKFAYGGQDYQSVFSNNTLLWIWILSANGSHSSKIDCTHPERLTAREKEACRRAVASY